MNECVNLHHNAGNLESGIHLGLITKKFAELIVQECAQKLEDDGMTEVAMELKEHFGVEE